MNDGLLTFRGVSFCVDDRVVVSELNASFRKNDITAILGKSGSGKTTIIKLLAGLLIPAAGEVYYEGVSFSSMTRLQEMEFRKASGFVFQDAALWVNQTVYQIVELPLRVHFPELGEKERFKKVTETVRKSGYTGELHVHPDELSAGEKKLIAFARATVCDPELLFLDECTESLDDAAAEKLSLLLLDMYGRGTTVIFISHDPIFIDRLARTVCHVEKGRIRDMLPYDEYRRVSASRMQTKETETTHEI